MILNKERRYFLYLIPYMEPQIFKSPGYEIGDKVFLLLKLISFGFIAFEYFCYMLPKRSVLKKYTILMVFMQGTTLISTIYNNGSITRYLGPAIASVSMLFLGELLYYTKCQKFFYYIETYLGIFYVINLITYIMRVVGVPIYPSFLGIDNRWIYFLLPWTIIAFINDYNKNKKLTYSKKIYIISLLSLVIVWSMGAVLAFLVLPISYYMIKLLTKKYSIVKSYISRLVFWVFLILNYILVNNLIIKLFANFIRNTLNKDITLSGRTNLWAGVIKVLKNSPFLGMGVQTQDFDLNFFYNVGLHAPGSRVNHPHNHLLYVAYRGGLLSVVVLLIIIYLFMKSLDKSKDKKYMMIVLSSIISIFTAALVDTLDFSLFYLMVPLIIIQLKKNERQKIKIDNINLRKIII